MLTSQRKDFDEKNDETSPYPKDFVRWYALDYFKRPGGFRSRRFWVTFWVTAGFTVLSLATMAAAPLHRTHQAAPVSTAHAMFNQNCANCHTETFAPLARLFGCPEAVSISDKTCNDCHHGAPHHVNPHPALGSGDLSCVTCHVEHRGHEVLASHVASRQCTACHGNLMASINDGEKTDIYATITSFNDDHPPFALSQPGRKDSSKIKFNHRAHLDLKLDNLRRDFENAGRDDLKGFGARLECIQCHQMDSQRQYMQPINYDQHCASCHRLTVPLVGDFAGDLKAKAAEFCRKPLPHKEPAVVRAVLRDRLVEFAQKNAVVSAKAGPTAVPRPFPWKPSAPITEEQWSWTMQQGTKAEDLLFVNRQWRKTEPLTWCSHCHIEKIPNKRIDGLPQYRETAIPSRWNKHSVFSHGAHRMMSCVECHDKNTAGQGGSPIKVADSQTAEHILLPTIQSCQECHRPSGSARNSCVECHRYHDPMQLRDADGVLKPGPDGRMTLQELLGKNR